jgi:hypothetical protein
MGATGIQVVMAAGLAGGIGLAGGGCGALATAVWLGFIDNDEKPEGFSIMTPTIQATFDRFLGASDHQMECAEIVGRKFEDPADHAAHVCNGGCARILAALASTGSGEKAA